MKTLLTVQQTACILNATTLSIMAKYVKLQPKTQKRKRGLLPNETVTKKHISPPSIGNYGELLRCFGTADNFDDRLCRRIVEKLANQIRGVPWSIDESGKEGAKMRFLLASGVRSALQGIVDAYTDECRSVDFAFEIPQTYTAVIEDRVPDRQLGAPKQKDRPRSYQISVVQTVEQMILQGFLTTLGKQSADKLAAQVRSCRNCKQLFFGRRQARTCSQRCRTALYRAENPDKQQESQVRAERARAVKEHTQSRTAQIAKQRSKTTGEKRWKKS
jgi:hypothetical protein